MLRVMVPSRFQAPVRATCLCSGCPWVTPRFSQSLSKPTSSSRLRATPPTHISIRHATHGAQGRANGPKNGPGKRLGAKKTGDQYVIPGNIIFRQRGTKWFPGENVGMGRDHTLFAREHGYVKYYRDPFLHPKRHYIGVVFKRDDALPTRRDVPRKRRLGLVAVPRTPTVTEENAHTPEQDAGNQIGILHHDVGNMGISITQAAKSAGVSRSEVKEFRRRKTAGRLPVEELQMRPDYSFRESNWSVGRAPDRAGVHVVPFKKGHRFMAWRKRTAKKVRAAEMASLSKKKGKSTAKKRKS